MTVYHVPGMTCGGCARSVTNAVKSVDADATVNVDLKTKLVTVDTQAAATLIADAIKQAGYNVEARAA